MDETQEQDTTETQRAAAVKKIFYTIPSPVEMASIIRQSGAPFDKSILNDVDHAQGYTDAKAQALNLGIYGADLSYASMFDQNQESIYYLSAAQKLAKDLGVEDAIDNEVYERINNNMESRDSLLQIVSEAYWSLNGYLKDDGREEVSALVIAGGWFEGLHLACSHVTADNEDLKKRIAEQKYALDDLLSLFSTYSDKTVLSSVNDDLASMKALYDEVQINKGKTETSQDDSGKMVIGGKTSYEMNEATLNKIVGRIDEIRNTYIQ
jgi:hypothetical protein